MYFFKNKIVIFYKSSSYFFLSFQPLRKIKIGGIAEIDSADSD